MIKRIRNPHQADILLFVEPQKISDWDESIRESFKTGQSFSPKTYDIMYISSLFENGREPDEIDMSILNSAINYYPELTQEIQERYPHIEFTGDMPLFDSESS